MEVLILVTISVVVAIIILAVTIFKSKSATKEKLDAEPADNEQGARGARRVAGVRGNQRARMRANVRNRRIDEEDDEIIDDGDENGQGEIDTSDFDKMGAKKRAKMEAKAERKQAREIEERNREEQKKKKQAEDLDSQKQRQRELELEKQKEEEEKKLREEQERKDHEEYLKMKAAFSVEEEGYMEGDQENEENMLQNFVKHIKENKVVILEDVASVFKLKTQSVIDRIQDLIKDGILTGVIDDRGKFIYITEAELKDVAKFIKQRGRISIEELAQSSNQLIHLTTAS